MMLKSNPSLIKILSNCFLKFLTLSIIVGPIGIPFFNNLNFVSASVFDSMVELSPQQRRCFGQELLSRTLMMASLTSEDGGPTLSVQISEDPEMNGPPSDGAQLLGSFTESGKREIKTALTSHREAVHWICVKNEDKQQGAKVAVKISTGRHQNYEALKKDEHLDPVEITIRQVEDMLKEYHSNLIKMRLKEEQTLEINDETTWKVLYVSLFNIFLTIIYGGWQMYAIKSYFKQKKII